MYKLCGYAVPETTLLRDLNVVERLDLSKGMSLHVSTCTSYNLNPLTLVVCNLWR